MSYLPRFLEGKLREYAKSFPVILVTGARQVGKTTMLRHALGAKHPFVAFDPIRDIHNVRRDPDLFLKQWGGPVILDEVQYAPELLGAIKRMVDEDKTPGRFFLTGSQNFALLRNISESLAGRVMVLRLAPMTVAETAGAGKSSWLAKLLENPGKPPAQILKGFHSHRTGKNFFRQLWRGGMPGILNLKDGVLHDFFESYVQTYVDRDVRQIGDVRDVTEFRRFLGLCAALTAQEVNHSQLGRDIGMTPQSAARWLALLEGTFLWRSIPAFSNNPVKRLSHKPKGYFADTGLCAALQFISRPEALETHPQRGPLFETQMAQDLMGHLSALSGSAAVWHWRTHAGAEIDLVLERDGWHWLFEIKSSQTLPKGSLRGFDAFRETYPKAKIAGSFVLAPVDRIMPVREGVFALPYDLTG